MNESDSYIRWFSDLREGDRSVLSEKARKLALAYNIGFSVPNGFVITSAAYDYLLSSSGIDHQLNQILARINYDDLDSVHDASKQIRALIDGMAMPKKMQEEIIESYEILDADKSLEKASATAMEILKHSYEPPYVAVRSALSVEGFDYAQFSRQQESFLNVKGNNEVISLIKKAMSSAFTPQALIHRARSNIAGNKITNEVIIQRMISAIKSGALSSRKNIHGQWEIEAEAVWGLGEGYSQGIVNPDYHMITGENDVQIKNSVINEKKIGVVRNSSGKNEIVKLSEERSKHQVLTNYEIKKLAQACLNFGEKFSRAQVMEFAIEGEQLHILQINSILDEAHIESDEKFDGKIMGEGLIGSSGLVAGKTKLINSVEDIKNLQQGDIMVTGMRTADIMLALDRCSGIILVNGGVVSSLALMTRQKGIPLLFGLGEEAHKFENDQVVSIDGFTGRIYEGLGKSTETKKEEKNEVMTLSSPALEIKKDSERQDIEEIILKELDVSLEGEDYNPAGYGEKKDVPPLNDAIPIDSSHFDEDK